MLPFDGTAELLPPAAPVTDLCGSMPSGERFVTADLRFVECAIREIEKDGRFKRKVALNCILPSESTVHHCSRRRASRNLLSARASARSPVSPWLVPRLTRERLPFDPGSFGQPYNGIIIGMSSVVKDIHIAMTGVKEVTAGPCCYQEHYTGKDTLYRRQAMDPEVARSISFGYINVELIQQNNDAQSVYRERVERSGYGFHLGLSRPRPSVPSTRSHYMDTTAEVPGMVDAIALGAVFKPLLHRRYQIRPQLDGLDSSQPKKERPGKEKCQKMHPYRCSDNTS